MPLIIKKAKPDEGIGYKTQKHPAHLLDTEGTNVTDNVVPIGAAQGHSSTVMPVSSTNAAAKPGDALPGIVDDDDPAQDGAHPDAPELTEDYLAEAFVSKFHKQLRYDHSVGRWYLWTGNYWARNETGGAFDQVRRFCRQLRHGNSRMASKKAVEGVEIMAGRDPRVAVKSDTWDKDPWVLGTPGGYIDLRTGELFAPDPKWHVSKQTAVAPDPKGTTAPAFSKFLYEVTGGDAALQRFLAQFAGYCLTGVTREQVLMFIYGPGGNGKSVLQNLLIEIMGDYATTAAMETFTASRHSRHLTELARLHNARLVGASETEKGHQWSEARINQLTGGDRITANLMRQDHFTFLPVLKLMIVGNHKPQLGTVNDAARRRFLIVPFLLKPKSPDKTLNAKLRLEYPAILRWMIEGCLDWQQNGLLLPEVVQQATNEYFEEEDAIARWIEEECELGPLLKTPASHLWNSWREYAVSKNELPGTAKSFGQMLGAKGFEKKKSGGITYFGIALKSVTKLNYKDQI